MLKMKQDSPFGPMEMTKSKANAHQAPTVPTVTAKAGTFGGNKYTVGWPNCSDDNDDQHIATIAQQVTKGISDPWRAALALQKWTGCQHDVRYRNRSSASQRSGQGSAW
jgi:hypothetical protein